MAKRVDEKCKNCEHLIVDRISKNLTRGSGHCHRIKITKLEKYFRKNLGEDPDGPKVRNFSSLSCIKFKERISELNIGKGTK